MAPAWRLLAGKTACITGGTTGIGRAITLEYLRQGCNVAVNHLGLTKDESLRKSLHEEAKAIQKEGPKDIPAGQLIDIAGDITDPATGTNLVAEAVRKWGALDIFVANAGIFKACEFLKIEKSFFDQSINVNVNGAFYTCQAAARQMVKQGRGGSIIGVSSISALVGGGLQVHYTPTKAAVLSMMQSMAIALAKDNIRCNALLPGTIHTQLAEDDMQNAEKKSYLEKRIPMGRVGRPEDMAGPAVFLASEALSGYMTGSQVLADGGILSIVDPSSSHSTQQVFFPIIFSRFILSFVLLHSNILHILLHGTEEERRFTRGRLSRGKGLRKTTGCVTCRRRRVKCDELKPKCGRCIKSMQECSYAPHPPQQHQRGNSTTTKSILTSSKSPPPVAIAESSSVPATEDILTSPHDQAQSTYCVLTEVPEQTWRAVNTSPYPNESFSTPINEPAPNTPLGIGPTWLPNKEPTITQHLSPQPSHLKSTPINVDRYGSETGTVRHGVAPSLPGSPDHCRRSLPGPLAAHTAISTNSNIETATARWLDLLIVDAVADDGLLPDFDFEGTGVDIFGNSIVHSPASDVNRGGSSDHSENSHASNPFLQERYIKLGGDQVLEKQAWHSKESLKLLPHEKQLFQSFVRHISCWMDFFDPKKPFGTFAPRLALHNVGLMNAILCLTARYLSLQPAATPCGVPISQLPTQNDAIQYYYKTLHYIQKAMQFDTYKTSLELLSTSLIVSTYEMLDGSSENWERHLKGVFWIQRSQTIHGDSRGLRQAVWWAWLCQDVWAAFREKRKPFTFWRPVRGLDELDPYELASRSVYFFAQAVGFCSKEEREEGKDDLQARLHRADSILQMLENWREHLTVEFEPLPAPPAQPDTVFPAVWIHPPLFGVAMQLYYCSIILVALERPLLGGIGDYLELRKTLSRCVQIVCGIAKTQEDYESSVMSSQCLYIAGLSVENNNERAQVLDMLSKRQRRCGWPTRSLGEDLLASWKLSNRTQ
ncbi:uncharacterized protein GGS22DRAFT_178901 [Annulohypoxylon maeteangense]|uniref:uncharacterized protein n=1 Tax=Annulohypoxylon maeteangense TaxID=1927788 RepID=UPI002007E858|nr:uncharacterized protein GGS22DRAFT_178901 [Annulohypoxylon maeteangense]KAI0886902.1 hypothetical protein GGS22DRAFT_178901 [Annulohypoxylon maeteangense]